MFYISPGGGGNGLVPVAGGAGAKGCGGRVSAGFGIGGVTNGAWRGAGAMVGVGAKGTGAGGGGPNKGGNGAGAEAVADGTGICAGF